MQVWWCLKICRILVSNVLILSDLALHQFGIAAEFPSMPAEGQSNEGASSLYTWIEKGETFQPGRCGVKIAGAISIGVLTTERRLVRHQTSHAGRDAVMS